MVNGIRTIPYRAITAARKARRTVKRSPVGCAYRKFSIAFAKAARRYPAIQNAIRMFMIITVVYSGYVVSVFSQHALEPVPIDSYDRANLALGIALVDAVPFLFIVAATTMVLAAGNFSLDTLAKNRDSARSAVAVMRVGYVFAFAGVCAMAMSSYFMDRANRIELASENNATAINYRITHLGSYDQALLLSYVSGDRPLTITARVARIARQISVLQRPDQQWILRMLRADLLNKARRTRIPLANQAGVI